MNELTEIFKCQVCHNVVEIVHSGEGELYCCGKPMIHLKANTDDGASQEKHVPIFDKGKIKVGSVLHPMSEEHHIEFIEAISPDKKYLVRKFLNYNEEPIMDTSYNYCADNFTMREFCNLHGVWSAEKAE